jgi:hypothetical protein
MVPPSAARLLTPAVNLRDMQVTPTGVGWELGSESSVLGLHEILLRSRDIGDVYIGSFHFYFFSSSLFSFKF